MYFAAADRVVGTVCAYWRCAVPPQYTFRASPALCHDVLHHAARLLRAVDFCLRWTLRWRMLTDFSSVRAVGHRLTVCLAPWYTRCFFRFLPCSFRLTAAALCAMFIVFRPSAEGRKRKSPLTEASGLFRLWAPRQEETQCLRICHELGSFVAFARRRSRSSSVTATSRPWAAGINTQPPRSRRL